MLFIFFQNSINHQNKIDLEGFENEENKKKSCITKIDMFDSLKNYLDKIDKINKNLLKPSYPIASNYGNNLEFNVLNEYGIKDIRKRQKYDKTIAKGVVSHNTRLLLKNFNKNLFDNRNEITRDKKKC